MKSEGPESKKNHISVNVAIAATFTWIGFVCAISFMEASLKFQAPGVTLVIGLSIGKIVFAALNRVEIVLSTIILISVISGKFFRIERDIFFIGAIIILLLQTFIVLPFLTERIDLLLEGKTPESSNVHFYFIIMEVMKVMVLLLYGVRLLKVNRS